MVGPITLYYYSDFKDYANDSDVYRFSKLLQDNKIRFYTHSIQKEPDDTIKRLCQDTGGNWNRWYLHGLETDAPPKH